MKESKDWGLILAVVGTILLISVAISTIIYQIIETNKACYNITFEYDNGSTVQYHCDYYYTHSDNYELFFHDGSKMIIFKSNLDNVVIDEVID